MGLGSDGWDLGQVEERRNRCVGGNRTGTANGDERWSGLGCRKTQLRPLRRLDPRRGSRRRLARGPWCRLRRGIELVSPRRELKNPA